MRIPSGKVDQNVYFHAESTTGGAKTGLTSFTVYRSRNGGAAAVYTTPTVTEISTANMPGLYSLLIDEDTTIAATSSSEEYALYITATGMLPVWTELELYGVVDSNIVKVNSITVNGAGTAGSPWGP